MAYSEKSNLASDASEASAARVTDPLHRDTHHRQSPVFSSESDQDSRRSVLVERQKPPFMHNPSSPKISAEHVQDLGGATASTAIRFWWRFELDGVAKRNLRTEPGYCSVCR
jgi:hypothetical protein